MRYEEIPAPPFLPSIERFWFASDRIDLPRHETIFPDGAFEIVFSLGERSIQDGHLQPRMMLAGETRRAVTIETSGIVDYVGVRLRVGAARDLLRMPLHEVRDAMLDLEDLWGGFARSLGERVAETKTAAARAAVIVDAFRARAQPSGRSLVVHAATAIRRNAGHLSVSRLAAMLGVSVETLRRVFEQDAGMTPKTLCRVLRMQRATGMLREGVDAAAVAVECGFYDQAHLVNEFRSFAGLSPSRYVEPPNGLNAAIATDFSKTD